MRKYYWSTFYPSERNTPICLDIFADAVRAKGIKNFLRPRKSDLKFFNIKPAEWAIADGPIPVMALRMNHSDMGEPGPFYGLVVAYQ